MDRLFPFTGSLLQMIPTARDGAKARSQEFNPTWVVGTIATASQEYSSVKLAPGAESRY